jgi:hypothetical protein
MSAQLHRAAICAGLAVSGFPALSQAQSTTVVLPERTELRRALPVAAAPIIQQSPNGLYKLSITDTGIELLGPQGAIRITDAGIEIGGPNARSVTIKAAGDMELKGDRTVKLLAGGTMGLEAIAGMNLKANGPMELKAAGMTSVLGSMVSLGCSSGARPAARMGDQVTVTPTTGSGPIIQGSPKVLVC